MNKEKALRGSLMPKAGFISIPRYFDYSPQEFLEIAPKGVGAIQRMLHLPGYTYELKQRADNFDLLEEGVNCLAEARCQVIGQTGVNWAHCTGTTPDDIRRICAQISDKCGAKYLMMGLCLVDALLAVGVKRISVSNGYYQDVWADGINRFLSQAGFEIVWSGTMVDQGLYDSDEEMHRIAEENDWVFSSHDVVQSIYQAHVAAPNADAVVQTGFGFRTRTRTSTIEALIGKPLITSDMSLYWAMLKEMKLTPVPGYGELMDTLC
ncbi:MAG: hypothetical protein HOI33_11180 [Rhodospirillaceae bacterium]|nr:hypothetical protein [Rhodospirillaceae bacterium]